MECTLQIGSARAQSNQGFVTQMLHWLARTASQCKVAFHLGTNRSAVIAGYSARKEAAMKLMEGSSACLG